MYCLYSICSFTDHFKKHGWAISQPIFEKEEDLSSFVEKMTERISTSVGKSLISWNRTGGGGSRFYTEITGQVVDLGVSQKIKNASEGIITTEYDTEMLSILMGGSDVQDPHVDGIGRKNGTSKGVSVVFAILDETYMNVYDKESIKGIYENGMYKGKSIEYYRVLVPKGKAFYFNSFTCYHGGDKYDVDSGKKWSDGTVDINKKRHIRVFARYTVKSSWEFDNNFYLSEKDIIEKICKGEWEK
jgi:hypothetical protein